MTAGNIRRSDVAVLVMLLAMRSVISDEKEGKAQRPSMHQGSFLPPFLVARPMDSRLPRVLIDPHGTWPDHAARPTPNNFQLRSRSSSGEKAQPGWAIGPLAVTTF